MLETPFGTLVHAGCQLQTYGCELGTTTNTCGNGVRDGWEDCDGTDLGATTCEGLGLTGTLACTPDSDSTSRLRHLFGWRRCGNGV